MTFDDQLATVIRKVCVSCSEEFGAHLSSCPHDGNLLVPLPTDPWIGRRLGEDFLIKDHLGTGGMGVVYLAKDERMDRLVAVKMLRHALVDDRLSVERFQREAKAAGRLRHQNVITLHAHGFTHTGQPYLVMEYLQGRSLHDLIKEDGKVGVERAIHILAQACAGLDHAHRQGVIHRDLKPANIMLISTEEDPDFVKVVDFGVAKVIAAPTSRDAQSLTQAGEVCGSPVYMSPEQCRGMDLDPRSDIYSMGVVIYETLTGKLPFLGKNMVETMSMHINEPPPRFADVRPDLFIPERVEAVVARALMKEPADRHPSMGELATELRRAIPRPGQNVSLRVAIPADPSLLREQEKRAPSWLIPAIAGGIAATLLAVGAVVAFMLQNKPSTPVAPAPATAPAPAPATAPAPASAIAPATAPATASLPTTVTAPGLERTDAGRAAASATASAVSTSPTGSSLGEQKEITTREQSSDESAVVRTQPEQNTSRHSAQASNKVPKPSARTDSVPAVRKPAPANAASTSPSTRPRTSKTSADPWKELFQEHSRFKNK